MTLDVATSGIFSAITILAMALPIVLTIRSRPGGAIDIAMLFAFSSGIVSTLAAYYFATTGIVFWSALNNAGYVMALGCMWCICAVLSDKSVSLRWVISGVLSFVVLVAPFFDDSQNLAWRGGITYLSTIALISIAVVMELALGQTRDLIQARACAWLFGLHGAYFIVRIIVFITAGPDSAFFVTWLSASVTTLFVVVLYVSGGVLMMNLRADILLRDAARRLQLDPMTNLLRHDDFRARAAQLLEELEQEGRRAVIIAVRIEHLHDLMTVYGRTASTAISKQLAAIAGEVFPVAALATRQSQNEFLWLVHDVTTERVRADANEIGSRLRSSRIDGLSFLSGVTVSFGIADANTIGYAVKELISAARHALPPEYGARIEPDAVETSSPQLPPATD